MLIRVTVDPVPVMGVVGEMNMHCSGPQSIAGNYEHTHTHTKGQSKIANQPTGFFCRWEKIGRNPHGHRENMKLLTSCERAMLQYLLHHLPHAQGVANIFIMPGERNISAH